ncbi:5-hydroxytryptamine receptor 2A-like [Babylonia areolata]|uniref:5-hydroxytryptamine receptor 2A-like n=1 Tax=Babylonia areolata TaxID=304850 RepID=UPI003FD065FA
MSNGSEADVSWLLPEESVTLTSVAAVLSTVAIVSNSLLISVVVRTAALRTPANFFIASLSAGELLTGLFVIPFAGTSASAEQWVLPFQLCRFVGLVSVLGPCASALSLLAVSTDRCLAVSKPFRYASLITRNSTVVIIVLVWGWSLLMSLLPLASFGDYDYSENFRVCVMRSGPARPGHVPEVVVKEVVCSFVPMALIVFTVLKSVHHIRMHRRVFAFVPALVAVTSVPAITNNMNARSSNVKASRTLLLVLTVFVTFCMPSAVASILCHRPSSCHVAPKLLRTLLWMSFLSCVIHPVIIMTLNRKFRSKLSSMLYQARCWRLLQSKGEKEPFTISTGLQTVLEASLFVNVVKPSGSGEGTVPRPSTYLTVLPSTMDRVTANLTVQPSVMEHSHFLQVPQLGNLANI